MCVTCRLNIKIYIKMCATFPFEQGHFFSAESFKDCVKDTMNERCEIPTTQ